MTKAAPEAGPAQAPPRPYKSKLPGQSKRAGQTLEPKWPTDEHDVKCLAFESTMPNPTTHMRIDNHCHQNITCLIRQLVDANQNPAHQPLFYIGQTTLIAGEAKGRRATSDAFSTRLPKPGPEPAMARSWTPQPQLPYYPYDQNKNQANITQPARSAPETRW